MGAQVRNLLFWVGAAIMIVLATVFYQPAAAKTGSLLIWMKNKVYVMDIDSLLLVPIGAAGPDEVMAPAPGCSGKTETPCWVIAGQYVYQISAERNGILHETILPIGQNYSWLNAPVSWGPDGQLLAYFLRDTRRNQAELQIYNATTDQIELTFPEVDSEVAAAWSADCAAGLNAAGCQIAFKSAGPEGVQVAAFSPATHETQRWDIPSEQIYELRWSFDKMLLYSDPPRHLHHVEDNTSAYNLPPGGQLANMSPDARYTVYYQPFTLKDCAEVDPSTCLNLGIWLYDRLDQAESAHLIYNRDLAISNSEGLNFIPTWSARGDATVFFQDGRLIHYDLETKEATIWYKSVRGKLRSVPIFSPNEEAVAFVDNQGQGYSEYRLVVVNPKLQPVEHIIETETGFRLLAWLPW
jgi:hypothetical protein